MNRHCFKTLSSVLMFAGLLSSTALATSNPVFPGLIPIHLKLKNGKKITVSLMNIHLSEAATKKITDHATQLLAHPARSVEAVNLPTSHTVGMGNQPVLNQGIWSSCVTFAVTGAINALFNYAGSTRISQLCNMQVGRSLNNPTWANGGWDGDYGNNVLSQIDQHGFMHLYSQRSVGCGGLKAYPTYSLNNGTAMSLSSFQLYSLQDAFTHQDWMSIYPNSPYTPISVKQAVLVLQNIKLALNKGDRVVIGFTMDSNPNIAFGSGAVGQYQTMPLDTWVLNRQIINDINGKFTGGHDIIVDGYDDNACASYLAENGQVKKQCGLLRLRNSWTSAVGIKGDYFMTYPYFMAMISEAYVVGSNVRGKFKVTT